MPREAWPGRRPQIRAACPVRAATAVCQKRSRGGAPLSDENLLDDLLSTWLDRYLGGDDVPASALCPGRPDLIPEIEFRVEAQRRMLALAHALAETDSSTSASPDPDSTLPEHSNEASPPSGITIPGYKVL